MFNDENIVNVSHTYDKSQLGDTPDSVAQSLLQIELTGKLGRAVMKSDNVTISECDAIGENMREISARVAVLQIGEYSYLKQIEALYKRMEEKTK